MRRRLLAVLAATAAVAFPVIADLLSGSGVPAWLRWIAWPAAIALAVPLVLVEVRRSRTPDGGDEAAELDRAAETLATAVLEQWQAEAAVRRLSRARRIALNWSRVDGPVDEDGDLDGIVTVYRGLPAGQLVILGAPGAGKSSVALLLTVGLLSARQPGGAVPVLVSLAAWDPRAEHLDRWLARRLEADYPGLTDSDRYGPGAAYRLVAQNRVLPVLDGLDEIPAERRTAALEGIDRAAFDDRPIVLTCRDREYSAAGEMVGPVLRTAAVIQVRPATVEQAVTYLGAAGGSRVDWGPVADRLRREPADPLSAVLSSPLMVALAGTAYCRGPGDPAELLDRQRFPDRDAIEHHLFDAYLPSVYADIPAAPGRRGERYPPDLAARWLGFLARRAQQTGTGELSWWSLFPQSRFGVLPATFGLGAAAALIVGVHNAILGGVPVGGVLAGVSGTAALAGAGIGVGLGAVALRWRCRRPWLDRFSDILAAGVLFGLLVVMLQHSRLARQILLHGHPAAEDVQALLAYVVTPGLLAGLTAGACLRVLGRHAPVRIGVPTRTRPAMVTGSIALGFLCALSTVVVYLASLQLDGVIDHVLTGFRLRHLWNRDDLAGAAAAAAVAAPVIGLLGLLATPVDVVRATSPGAALRGDRMATLLRALGIGLVVAIIAMALSGTQRPAVLAAFAAGAVAGAAGRAWTRFVVGRASHAWRGDVPWRLMAFLEDAHTRGVLRQNGASYQFRHQRLRDRLAERVPPAG